MKFGAAIRALENGARVRRECWHSAAYLEIDDGQIVNGGDIAEPALWAPFDLSAELLASDWLLAPTRDRCPEYSDYRHIYDVEVAGLKACKCGISAPEPVD